MEELIKMMEKLVNLPGQIAELEKKMQELEDNIGILTSKETRLLRDEDDLLTIADVIKQYNVSRNHFYHKRKEKNVLEYATYGKRKKVFKRKDVELALFTLRQAS